MKVILVYPDLERCRLPRLGDSAYSGDEGYGISCLSAALKKAGHRTSLIHVVPPLGRESFLNRLAKHIAGEDKILVAFSSTSNMFPYTKEMSKWIKEEYDLTVICGGIHATVAPEEVINVTSIDAICRGEGDEALVEFCNLLEEGKDNKGVLNFWIKNKEHIYKNPVRPLIADLDELPFPDKNIFDFPNLEGVKVGTAGFIASRGCPFNCTYCCNHTLRRVYDQPKNYVRFKSVDYILAEITSVVKEYPAIKRIYFDDDILSLKKDWFEEFAHKYPQTIGLPFGCNFRPNLANPTVVRLLKRAGCERVHLGIESGNDRIRRKILGRNISNEQIINACRMFKKNKIKTFAYNMIGIPFEGPREILDTVVCNARAKVDFLQASILYPYEKTDIYELCKKEGLLSSRLCSSYFRESVLVHPYLSKTQIKAYQRLFKFMVRLYSLAERLSGNNSRVGFIFLDLLFTNKWFLQILKYLSDTYNLLFIVPLRLIYRNFLSQFAFIEKLKRKFINYSV